MKRKPDHIAAYTWREMSAGVLVTIAPPTCSCGGACPAYMPVVYPVLSALDGAIRDEKDRMEREVVMEFYK